MTTPDALFGDPRLAPLYDVFDDDRSDLDAYVALVAELGAHRVMDLGCGTGSLAVRLAADGVAVIGVDPAAASLTIARAKPGGDLVTWVEGDATTLPARGPEPVDLAVMTGNVAQVFVTDDAWTATLRAVHAALEPGGHLVFETRVPGRRAWEGWTPEATRRSRDVPDVGVVETWTDVLHVREPLVTFAHTYLFEGDGDVLVSESTLRFRTLAEVTGTLQGCGFDVVDVRDAPDRPGLEHVLVARRLGA